MEMEEFRQVGVQCHLIYIEGSMNICWENKVQSQPVFASAFMNITWNFICWSKDTTTIHLNYLEWTKDCLRIYLSHMKNDQTGDQKRDPRHIYADPIDPTVYPILALAIYFSTFSISNTKDTALFPGKNQCRQFSKYFELILN